MVYSYSGILLRNNDDKYNNMDKFQKKNPIRLSKRSQVQTSQIHIVLISSYLYGVAEQAKVTYRDRKQSS